MLLKVVSYPVIYWYTCRFDAGCCHRVVNKDSRFVAFHFASLTWSWSWSLLMPASLLLSFIMSWCPHKLRVVRTCV